MTNRLLLAGLALIAVAVAAVLVATWVRGPLNPSCAGRPYEAGCFALVPTILMWSALPIAIVGALFVAMWLARRKPVDP